MTNRFIESADDLRRVRLRQGRVEVVTVAEYYVGLVLGFPDGTSATIQVESGGHVGEASRTFLEAGPELGSALTSFLGDVVVEQGAANLDLQLAFDSGRTVTIVADESGYESYTIAVDGNIDVMIRPPRGVQPPPVDR